MPYRPPSSVMKIVTGLPPRTVEGVAVTAVIALGWRIASQSLRVTPAICSADVQADARRQRRDDEGCAGGAFGITSVDGEIDTAEGTVAVSGIDAPPGGAPAVRNTWPVAVAVGERRLGLSLRVARSATGWTLSVAVATKEEYVAARVTLVS